MRVGPQDVVDNSHPTSTDGIASRWVLTGLGVCQNWAKAARARAKATAVQPNRATSAAGENFARGPAAAVHAASDRPGRFPGHSVQRDDLITERPHRYISIWMRESIFLFRQQLNPTPARRPVTSLYMDNHL